MGRPWKLALGAVIVLVIVVWDVGLPGRHSAAPPAAATSPSPSPTVASILPDPPPPGVPGVLQPTGQPEFVATFTGSQLNSHIWDTCYPWMSQSGCQNFGNSQYEGEWYIPGQAQVSGGLLHLVAQRQPVAGKSPSGAPKLYGCRSGMVTSYPGLQFQYGYLQIVAKIPTGGNLWAALWLAAANFQWPPEVDIIESWGASDFYSATYLHWKTPAGPQFVGGPITPAHIAAGPHTFALSWTKTQMTWLIDGVVIRTVRQNIPQQKMYLIADLAQAITPQAPAVTPGECNGSLDIRSVMVWPA